MLNRRTFQLVLPVALLSIVLGISGCSKEEPVDAQTSATQSGQDLLDQIRTKGKIVIATEGTWSPWTFHDQSGKLTGYDIEVGRLIAQRLGVEPQFVEGKWDGLLAGISAGRYDIMINGVDMTPEREKAYRFTEPYAYNRTVVIVSDQNTEIKSMQDLKGKQTANTISSTYAEIAEKYGAKVDGVDDLNQTFELLLSVKIAAIADETTSVGIPLKKEGTEKLQAELNKILNDLRASGELSKLSTQFFGTDISKK